MSTHSKIEWTDATWNPVRGCFKISPGCKHCYAEAFAERFRGVPGHPYEQGFDVRLIPEKLAEPLRWTAPKMVFVNSMSDLFQDAVPDDFIILVARMMEAANWHTFQVLTKRAGRMRKLLQTKLRFVAQAPHIWWGVSVEDRKHGLPRIADLRKAPAKVRFLSIEPLLHRGALILVNLSRQDPNRLKEKLVAAYLPNERGATVKILQEEEKGKYWILHPVNPVYKDRVVSKREEGFQVAAVETTFLE